MPAIDVHAHMIVPASLDAMRHADPDAGPELVWEDSKAFLLYPGRERMGPVPAKMFDLDARLAEMDRQRVALQIVAVPPPQFYYHVEGETGRAFARLQNDALVDVANRHPDRLNIFATLPLQDVPGSVAEIERMAANPLVRGVQLGTNVNGNNLDDPSLDPVWAALEECDLPVWVHPDQRSIAGGERLGTYYLQNLIGNPLETTIAIAALIFGGVLERHRRLRFGFVHGGGFTPYQIGRWDHGWGCRPEPRAHIDVPPREYFREMYFDSLTHDGLALEMLGRRVGWDHVMLGSDYPFDMASGDPVGAVEALALDERDRHAVLESNAQRFLRPIPA